MLISNYIDKMHQPFYLLYCKIKLTALDTIFSNYISPFKILLNIVSTDVKLKNI